MFRILSQIIHSPLRQDSTNGAVMKFVRIRLSSIYLVQTLIHFCYTGEYWNIVYYWVYASPVLTMASEGANISSNCNKGITDPIESDNACKSSDGKTKQMVQHRRKKYQCKVCDQYFVSPSKLKNHFRMHTGERPYQCKVCEKVFSQLSSLKRHSRIHTGDRPYTCKVCDKNFASSSTLKVHMLVHNEERTFQCEICGKRYRFENNLRGHMRVHSGENRSNTDAASMTSALPNQAFFPGIDECKMVTNHTGAVFVTAISLNRTTWYVTCEYIRVKSHISVKLVERGLPNRAVLLIIWKHISRKKRAYNCNYGLNERENLLLGYSLGSIFHVYK